MLALLQEALLIRGGLSHAHLEAWAEDDDGDGNDSLLDFDEEVRAR